MKHEIYTAYCPDRDMTFIMEVQRVKDIRIENVVGYYYGEPNDEDTKEFCGDLVGVLEL